MNKGFLKKEVILEQLKLLFHLYSDAFKLFNRKNKKENVRK